MERKWLKIYREEKKLTQEQTAASSGIARSYYTRIENGTKTPSIDVAKAIAKTLNFNWVVFLNQNVPLKNKSEEQSKEGEG